MINIQLQVSGFPAALMMCAVHERTSSVYYVVVIIDVAEWSTTKVFYMDVPRLNKRFPCFLGMLSRPALLIGLLAIVVARRAVATN
jgi:hypothetical protein